MIINGVTFSTGNTKIGEIANLSLPPVLSCGKDVPCASSCYALKAMKQYPATRAAWTRNLEAYRASPELFFQSVRAFLILARPPRFRIHVAGDFVDQAYLDGWVATAKEFPDTHFLAFTKRFDLTFPAVTGTNITIVFSMWPGFGDPTVPFPKAWMKDPKNLDTRIPETAYPCSGNCDADCFLCWNLNPDESVVFEKH